MTYKRAALLVAAAVLVTACKDDAGPTTPNLAPAAYVRYVHAVPDTGATDWRPIDRLEDSPPAFGLGFRGSTPYQAMGAGARRLRIFPTSTNIDITSQILLDSTITFEANTYYTLVYSGSARSNTDHLIVIEDDRPASVGASQFGLRVVHAGGMGAVDVVAEPSGGGTAITTFANVAPESATPYQQLATGAMTLRARQAGTTTGVVNATAAPAGTAATASASAIAGTTVAGSLLTAIVVPGAVAGSTAGGSTSPTIVYLLDNRPAGTQTTP